MSTVLRQRMIDDLSLAGFSQRTKEAYVRAMRQMAEHYRRPPDIYCRASLPPCETSRTVAPRFLAVLYARARSAHRSQV